MWLLQLHGEIDDYRFVPVPNLRDVVERMIDVVRKTLVDPLGGGLSDLDDPDGDAMLDTFGDEELVGTAQAASYPAGSDAVVGVARASAPSSAAVAATTGRTAFAVAQSVSEAQKNANGVTCRGDTYRITLTTHQRVDKQQIGTDNKVKQ